MIKEPFRHRKIWNRINYLILFLCVVAAYIFYYSYYLLLLLVLMIGFPVFTYVSGRKTCKNLSVSLKSAKNRIHSVEEDSVVHIGLANTSLFAGGSVTLIMHIENCLYPSDLHYEVTLPAYGKGTIQADWTFETCYSGIVTVKAETIYVRDFLGLFSWKKPSDAELEVLILPTKSEIQLSDLPRGGAEGMEEETIMQKGDDPSEIIEMRSYVPGDNLRRIHWKLSARQDSLMVKEFGSPVGQKITLFLDLRKYEDSVLLDEIFCAFYSTALYLLETEGEFRVRWLYGGLDYLEEAYIKNENDLIITLGKIYRTKLPAEEIDVIKQFVQLQEDSVGLALCVTGSAFTDMDEESLLCRFGEKAVIICV